VNLSTITGVVNRADINKNKVMEESLKTILGGDVSPQPGMLFLSNSIRKLL
jgi:hypothetical protein